MDKVSTNRQDAKILAKPDNAEYAVPEDVESSGARSSVFRAILSFLTNPYFTLISRLVLGGIFLLAGLTKLGDFKGMVDSIDSYQIYMGLPVNVLVSIENALATVLPPLEIVLGILILVGLFTRWAAAITGVLVVVFLIAMTQAMLRGFGSLIDCGCFATGPHANPIGSAIITALGPIGKFLTSEKAGPDAIARDLLFLLMAVHLMFVPTVFGLDNLRNRGSDLAYETEEYDQPEEEVAQ